MKKRISILVVLVILAVASTTTSLAQSHNTANSSVGANIVKALTLTQNAPLHFGSMSIPTAAVSVSLTTSNGRISSSPSNITLLSQAPVSENATYTVAGSNDATYVITLPANGAVTISNGTKSMDIVDFVAHTASAGVDGSSGHLNGEGSDSFTVGATLKLENDQPFGNYTGTFGITVNYN
ncbi:MAG: DUF4402 domain-containing protein [Bacteroidota bacterium]